MIGQFLFLYLLATAFGRFLLRDEYVHPIGRIANTRRTLQKNALDYLGREPSLRSPEDFVKLPKEIFKKLFLKHQQDNTLNDNIFNDHIPQPSEFTSDPLDPPALNPNDINYPDNKTGEFKPNPNDANNDVIKKVVVLNNDEVNSNKDDIIKYKGQQNYNNYNNRDNSENAVKLKLLQLIRKTKSSVDKKIEPVQTVHDLYKQNKMYKVGYLVSNINRTQDSLKEFHNYVEKNIKLWDVMKVLNAYDQVKTADEFLSKALYILNLVGATSSYARVLKGTKPYANATTSKNIDSDVTDRLAWSYYDDNM